VKKQVFKSDAMVSFNEEKLLRTITIVCGVAWLAGMASVMSLPSDSSTVMPQIFFGLSYIGGPIAIGLLSSRLGYPSITRYRYMFLAFLIPITLLAMGFMSNVVDKWIRDLKALVSEITKMDEEAIQKMKSNEQNALESSDRREEISYKQLLREARKSEKEADRASKNLSRRVELIGERNRIVKQISHCRNPYLLKYLISAENDEEACIRELIVIAIGNYKNQIAINALENILKNDPVSKVREKATESLKKLAMRSASTDNSSQI
jgi:hypothetical protein